MALPEIAGHRHRPEEVAEQHDRPHLLLEDRRSQEHAGNREGDAEDDALLIRSGGVRRNRGGDDGGEVSPNGHARAPLWGAEGRRVITTVPCRPRTSISPEKCPSPRLLESPRQMEAMQQR